MERKNASQVTEAQVAAAADAVLALKDEATRVTVTEVQEELEKRIGIRGDRSKVCIHLRTWKEKRRRLDSPSLVASEVLPEEVDNVLVDASSQMSIVVERLRAALSAVYAAAKAQAARDCNAMIESLRTEADAARRDAETGELEAQEELAQKEAENAAWQVRGAELEAALAEKSERLAAAEAKIEEKEQRIAELLAEKDEKFERLLQAVTQRSSNRREDAESEGAPPRRRAPAAAESSPPPA